MSESTGSGGARLGVGIVGTGLAARMHTAALRLVPAADIRGVVGTSPAKASACAESLGLPRGYRDLEECLADPSVQVLHICTPPHTHVELCARAAAAGRHLVVDKPLARTVAEADQIIDACARAGVLLCGLFQHRNIPLCRAVKEAVDAGRLGHIYLADCIVKWWRNDEYYRGSSWRARRDTEGGGALINQAIHSIDLLQWLAGPVVEVAGYTATAAHAIETEDLGVAVLRLQGGAVGVLEGTTAAYPGFPERIELHGTGGSVILDEGRRRIEWYLRGEEPRVQEEGVQQGNAADPAAVSPEAHAAAFADFLDAVRSGRAPTVDGNAARRALEIVEAVYRSSAQGGKPVSLPL